MSRPCDGCGVTIRRDELDTSSTSPAARLLLFDAACLAVWHEAGREGMAGLDVVK